MPRPRQPNRFARERTACLAALLGALFGAECVVASPVLAQPERVSKGDHFSVLLSSQTTEAARQASAASLLRAELTRAERRRIISLLSEPTTDPRVREAILLGFGQASMVDPDFEEPLAGLVAVGDERQRPITLRALAAVGTPSAVRVLIDHAADYLPEPVSLTAVECLVRITGRDDLGSDQQAWADWLRDREGMDTEAWNAELLRGVIERGQRLDRDLGLANERTADVYRRLFLVAPFQDRGPLLAEMLRAEAPLRDLGIELLYRELSQSRQIDPQVGIAAMEMLGAQTAEVRAEAARLVATLNPEGAGTKLARALEIESDPVAAASLLAASAKWPRVSSVRPALRWLDFGAQTRSDAATLLLALDTEGLLTDPADRRRIADALRAAGPQRLTPDGVRLTVRTGTENDRAVVIDLLPSLEPNVRAAAASELARRPEFAERILLAADRDEQLFAAAVAAVATHRATPLGYAALRAIQPPSPDAQRTGLLAVARVLTPVQLLETAQSYEPDPELRIAILLTVGSAAGDAAEREAIDQTRLLLAQTQLDLGRPDAALTSLAAFTPAPDRDELIDAAQTIRVTSLLWLNRIDEAAAINAGADVWLDSLDRIGTEPHAPAVAQAAIDRFRDVLGDDELDRLRATATLADEQTDGDPTASDAEPIEPAPGSG
ncbi:MAG: hypothetical protein AAGH71_00855 [Planctomycetota bacterium]